MTFGQDDLSEIEPSVLPLSYSFPALARLQIVVHEEGTKLAYAVPHVHTILSSNDTNSILASIMQRGA